MYRQAAAVKTWRNAGGSGSISVLAFMTSVLGTVDGHLLEIRHLREGGLSMQAFVVILAPQ